MTTGSGKFDEYLSIAQQIAEQQKLEDTLKKHFAPVAIPIVAKTHTSVYNMHRFFARRPFNVFEAMVKHYTNPGDIVTRPPYERWRNHRRIFTCPEESRRGRFEPHSVIYS